MTMERNHKLIALTDLETTGDIFSRHEILDIGLVLFDSDTGRIVDTLNTQILPTHIENAVPEALTYNGYTPEKWSRAIPLKDAMLQYQSKTKDAIFCAYNVSFDWGFINEAFAQCSLDNPMSTRENHDRLDLLTLAWSKGLRHEKSFSLKSACTLFGIEPEPEPHTALDGAMTAYKLWMKINSL
jgi:DNA polymerase III epsilon subunit-like protein